MINLDKNINRCAASSEGSVLSTVATDEGENSPPVTNNCAPISPPLSTFQDADSEQEEGSCCESLSVTETAAVFEEALADDEPKGNTPETPSDESQDFIVEEMRKRAVELRNLISEQDNSFKRNGSFGCVDLSYRFNPRLIAKGETLIEDIFDLTVIIDTLQDLSQDIRPQWDHDFVSGEVISPKYPIGDNEYLCLTWCAFKGRYGFPGRDFCWYQYTWVNESKTESIHIAASLPVGTEPQGFKPGQRGNYIRASTHMGGYKFSVMPDKGTHVVFFNQTDIGSNLPSWIIDSVLKKSPSKLEYFRKFITSQ